MKKYITSISIAATVLCAGAAQAADEKVQVVQYGQGPALLVYTPARETSTVAFYREHRAVGTSRHSDRQQGEMRLESHNAGNSTVNFLAPNR